ncbi:MAG: Zn-ribbon-containing protein [Clostridiales bacterium]|nr:Zn-ribbon-containing protein [Clostridiales bacterium]
MNSAKITVTPKNPIASTDDALDLLWDYLRSLYNNGQILKNYELVKVDIGFVAFITLPEDDALDEKYNSIYVSQYLAQMKAVFRMTLKIIGENLNAEKSCACEKSSWYMLYTDFTQTDSPVVCGDCGESVPLYRLPHLFNEDEHHGILGWKETYSEIDSLWMYCLSDRFTYRQLHNPDSALSKIGRDICRELEKATDTPTYYYLYHYDSLSGTRKTPAECPICGADWKLNGEKTFIDYKCEPCRLVADEV